MSATPSIQQARVAAGQARAERANALLSVAGGLLSVADVLTEAATATGTALRRIPLVQVLAAQPGWTMAAAERAVLATLQTVQAKFDPGRLRKVRLDWVLDTRTGGTRQLALADVLFPGRDEVPWPGFPYSMAPEGAAPAVKGVSWATSS